MLRILIVAAAAAFVLAAAPAPRTADVENRFDPAATRAQSFAAWEKFNAQFQNRWRVEWNEITGTPHYIVGHRIPIARALSHKNVDAECRAILKRYRAAFQADPRALALSKVDFDPPVDPKRSSGTWYVYYRQVYRKLPVEGGSVRLVIRNGAVASIASDFYPGIDMSTKPAVTMEKAIALANETIGIAKPLRPLDAALVIYPAAVAGIVRYCLAWRLTMPVAEVPLEAAAPEVVMPPGKEPPPERVDVQWRYFIDARTGDVLMRLNLLETEDISGTVTGMIHPRVPGDPPVSAPLAGMAITFTQGSNVFGATTDASGSYLMSGLSGEAGTLTANLSGPDVIVYNEETPDPDATHTAAVSPTAVHDWSWMADDPSPEDVETNVFYHVTLIRNWFLRGDPFDVSPSPYPMVARVRYDAGCNASASPAGLNFRSGIPGGCSDYGLCADIVYHEYTHRIAHALYDAAGVSFPYSGFPGAMNEAWADYFGASLTNDPLHGGGCSAGRNIDTPDRKYPVDWTNEEVHHDGMILSGALWDLRASLTAEYVDGLALRAMKNAPSTFAGYLEALLLEDDDPAHSANPLADNDLSNGTPSIDVICGTFTDAHGIFCEACAGHTMRPFAHIGPPLEGNSSVFGSATTSIEIVGSAGGGASSPMLRYTIELGSGSNPSAWTDAGITLAGGGTSPVSNGVLGTLSTASLVDGVWALRLVVTDALGQRAVAETFFLWSRSLLAGWPQMRNTRFYASPAVAELDPASPGLEIAAVTWYYPSIVVFRRDGSIAPGWPRGCAQTMAPPAVGDIDADGDNEIVVAGSWGVYVYHHDGTCADGWFQPITGGWFLTPSLADLDNDGDLEICATSYDGKVHAWHHDGLRLLSWPKETDGSIRCATAVGDVDGDAIPEVFAGNSEKRLYAWHGYGEPLAGWPASVDSTLSAPPVIGDIDGDGDSEIVAGTLKSSVYAWHSNGTLAAGWPRKISGYLRPAASPALADLDGDCLFEIVLQGNNDSVYAWNGDGTRLADWPPSIGPGCQWNQYEASSPVASDVNGDGVAEIIAGGINALTYRYQVYALNADATAVAGWPQYLGTNKSLGPAVADIDLDGKPECIAASDGIWIWKLPGPVTLQTAAWPFARHDLARTGNKGGCMAAPQTTYASFAASGGSRSVTVAAETACCPWTAVSNDEWITVASGASGTGGGAVEYSVARNEGLGARNGSIRIGDTKLVVNQAARMGIKVDCPEAIVGLPFEVSVTLFNGDCEASITVNEIVVEGEITNGRSDFGLAQRLIEPPRDRAARTFPVHVVVPPANCSTGRSGASNPTVLRFTDRVSNHRKLRGKTVQLKFSAYTRSGALICCARCSVPIKAHP